MGKSATTSTNRKPPATSAPNRPNPTGSVRDAVTRYGRITKNRESCQMTKKCKVPDSTEHLGTDAQFKALSEKIDAIMASRYGDNRIHLGTQVSTGASAAPRYPRRDWNRSEKVKVGKPMRAPQGKGVRAWDVRLETVPENKPMTRGSN